ncbi:MAG: hypothetical protein ACC700_19800, partial [Anaerolineales bacterium]
KPVHHPLTLHNRHLGTIWISHSNTRQLDVSVRNEEQPARAISQTPYHIETGVDSGVAHTDCSQSLNEPIGDLTLSAIMAGDANERLERSDITIGVDLMGDLKGVTSIGVRKRRHVISIHTFKGGSVSPARIGSSP